MEPLLKEYAELDEKFKLLEETKSILRDQILNLMKLEEKDREETEFGTFSVGRRTTWEYSPAVKALEEKLKITKIKEQDKSVAKPKVNEYLLFTKPKSDE